MKSIQLLFFLLFNTYSFQAISQVNPYMDKMPALVSEEVMAEYQAKIEEMNNPNVALYAHAVCQLTVDEINNGATQRLPNRNLGNYRAGGADIEVVYNGFTTEAQTAFQYAVDIWASCLDSDITIRVMTDFLPLAPGVLGGAGPVSVIRDAPGLVPGTWYGEALANKITGVDLVGPGMPDIASIFSSTITWYFGTDGNPPPGTFDFVTVVLHELGHGLGFFGLANATPGPPPSGIYGLFGFPAIYNRFVENGSGMVMTDFPISTSSQPLGQYLQSNDLFLNGIGATAGNSGILPKIFTPSSWIPGSSFSHWDEMTFLPGDQNSLMTPFIGFQEVIHDVGPSTLGAFEDMGWTVVAKEPIPTMSEWGIIILSLLFGSIGLIALKRKKVILT